MAGPRPWRLVPDGALVAVRVTPNAGADRLEGIETRDDGQPVLKLRVAAVPDRGRANAAAIALLAKALGLPKSSLAVTAGATARLKTIALSGDPAALGPQLEALLPAGPAAP